MKKIILNIQNQKLKVLIFVCSLLCFQIHAAPVYWLGGTGDWHVQSNWDTGVVPNFGDVVYINSGVVQITNNAKADYLFVDNNAAVEIQSSGGLYLNNGETMLGIFNQGSIINHGLIDITQTYGGISNESGATFDNYGDMSLTQAGGFGLACIMNQGVFKNWGNGVMRISAIAEGAGTITNWGSNASFINKGDISITDCNTSSIIREDGHLFLNDRYASMDIEDVEGMAIQVWTNGTFRNKSNIYISEVDLNSSIGVYGFMVNHQRGNIYIDHAVGIRVFSGAEMRNYGLTKLTDEEGYSLNVNGVFANRPMGKFICTAGVYVAPGASLASQGHFVSDFQGTGNHSIGGACTNTGVFNDVNNDLITSVINNQSVIIKPLSGIVQNGVPISNALELGSLAYVTVQGWYISESSSVSAGSYDSANNTFTPNANAIGLDAVWVKIKINQGNRVHRHKVSIPNTVQAIASSNNDSVAAVQGEDETKRRTILNKVLVYPNPTIDRVSVQLTSFPEEGTIMYLTDFAGRLIMQEPIQDMHSTLTIPESIGGGIYTVTIMKNDRLIYTTKLVVH